LKVFLSYERLWFVVKGLKLFGEYRDIVKETILLQVKRWQVVDTPLRQDADWAIYHEVQSYPEAD